MERQSTNSKIVVFTIGHSTRSIGEFVALLQSNGVCQLIDIRTIPRSRRNPQFSTDALAASLRSAGIAYIHLKPLGGLRQPHKDSTNLGWRNASFRGYADHMQTAEFDSALARVIELAAQSPTALMCAEAVPWRCHRSLVSDALLARNVDVREIINAGPPEAHKLTSFARISGNRVTYPKEGTELQLELIAPPNKPASES